MENDFNQFEKYQTADTVSYRRDSVRRRLKTVAYYTDEEFKEHPEHPRYMIGSKGTVYDKLLDRKLPHKNEGGRKGDYYESVYIKEDDNNVLVHRLVLETFDPNPNSQNLQVNHIDGNKHNNSWSPNPEKNNLEWCTPKENIQHASKIGKMRKAGEHPRAVFTNDEVHKICQMMSDGKSSAQIAQEFNLDFTPQVSKNLSDIRNGFSYSSISSQYKNLHNYNGENHIRLNTDIVTAICELLVQGKKAPEIAEAVGLSYGDGKKIRSIIQGIKSGQSYRDITQNYTFSYRNGAKGYRDK